MSSTELLARLLAALVLWATFAWAAMGFFALYRKGKIKLRPEAQKRFEKMNIAREEARARKVGWVALALIVLSVSALWWLQSPQI